MRPELVWTTSRSERAMILVSDAGSNLWKRNSSVSCLPKWGKMPPLLNSGCLLEGKEHVRIDWDFKFVLRQIFHFEAWLGLSKNHDKIVLEYRICGSIKARILRWRVSWFLGHKLSADTFCWRFVRALKYPFNEQWHLE